MSRLRFTSCIVVAALSMGAGACHHATPVTVAPAPAPIKAPNTDSIAAANARREAARRDSIARADAARREAAAREEAARRAAAEAAARATIGARIYFDFDQDSLRSDAMLTLDAKFPVLKARPDMHIRIEGNADERGSDTYNLALGQRRSAEAKRYLVARGIAEGRIEVVSFGKERPVCQEHDEACWSRNRRDEFVITAGSVASTDASRER